MRQLHVISDWSLKEKQKRKPTLLSPVSARGWVVVVAGARVGFCLAFFGLAGEGAGCCCWRGVFSLRFLFDARVQTGGAGPWSLSASKTSDLRFAGGDFGAGRG
jgi:hypothetical protein